MKAFETLADNSRLPDGDRYLTDSQIVRHYGGRSKMTLWRWRKSEKVGFPGPDLVVAGQNLTKTLTIAEWERHQLRAGRLSPTS